MKTVDHARLDAAIATVCADAELLAAMDAMLVRAGRSDTLPFRWDAGGCLVLAEAIRRVTGGILMGAFEEGADGEADDTTLDHVFVELSDDLYVDAFGHCTLDTLFDRVVEIGGFESPVLLPLNGVTDPRLAAVVIAFDEPLTARLSARLRAELAG
jgi:hypothetical protein